LHETIPYLFFLFILALGLFAAQMPRQEKEMQAVLRLSLKSVHLSSSSSAKESDSHESKGKASATNRADHGLRGRGHSILHEHFQLFFSSRFLD
jgi:hypothetical protein